MNLPRIFAKALTAFGTNSVFVVIADDDPYRRLASISPEAVDLLRRLISARRRGVEVASLSPRELRALHSDLETTLAIRLHRTRKPGFVILAGNVSVVDQRISLREVA